MPFGYARNSGISWFRDYGDALHKYENTTDIRGRVVEPKRPLGHRKNVDCYSIVKLGNGDIQCVLYKTPVVTFHTDNTVTVNTDSWASQTTANFIPEVLGYKVSARVFAHKLVLYINGNEYFLESNKDFKLHKENGEWVASNPAPTYIHHIKRKESNNVIQNYNEFIGYMQRMRKLRHDGERAVFTKQEIEDCFGKDDGGYARRTDISLTAHFKETPNIYTAFRKFISDTSESRHESFYKALLMLVNTVSWIDWTTEERRMKSQHWEQADNLLKNMIWGYHRDTVFKPVQVESGVVKKDNYARFFEGSWEHYYSSEMNQKNS